tara:strand:+ start:3550 stop:5601 length:2052 start_codon:yes stop_codon:yes gene_type:complete
MLASEYNNQLCQHYILADDNYQVRKQYLDHYSEHTMAALPGFASSHANYVIQLWKSGLSPFHAYNDGVSAVDVVLARGQHPDWQSQFEVLRSAIAVNAPRLANMPGFYSRIDVLLQRRHPPTRAATIGIVMALATAMRYDIAKLNISKTNIERLLVLAARAHDIENVMKDVAHLTAWAANVGCDCGAAVVAALGGSCTIAMQQRAVVCTFGANFSRAATVYLISMWPSVAFSPVPWGKREMFVLHIALVTCAQAEIVELLCALNPSAVTSAGCCRLAAGSKATWGPHRALIDTQYMDTGFTAMDIAMFNCFTTEWSAVNAMRVVGLSTQRELRGCTVFGVDWFHTMLVPLNYGVRKWGPTHTVLYNTLAAAASVKPVQTHAISLRIPRVVVGLGGSRGGLGKRIVRKSAIATDSIFGLACKSAPSEIVMGLVPIITAETASNALRLSLGYGHEVAAEFIHMGFPATAVTGVHAKAALRGLLSTPGLSDNFAANIIMSAGSIRSCCEANPSALWYVSNNIYRSVGLMRAILNCADPKDIVKGGVVSVVLHSSRRHHLGNFIELLFYVAMHGPQFVEPIYDSLLEAVPIEFSYAYRCSWRREFCIPLASTVRAVLVDSGCLWGYWSIASHVTLPRAVQAIVYSVMLVGTVIYSRGLHEDTALPPEVWEIILSFVSLRQLAHSVVD